MIVKNEEKFLERCLESVAPWVDEIVIVDTGSTDTTKEIAAKFTKNIYDFTWVDDYSAARNFAIEKATGDWIFRLDAGDIVPEDLGQRLRILVSGAHEDVGCFLTEYRSVEVNAQILHRTSLFRKHPDIYFIHTVHEQLIIGSFKARNIQLFILEDRPMLTKEAENKKFLYYSKLLEKDLLKFPNDCAVLFHYAMSLISLKRFSEAEDIIHKFLRSEWQKKLYADMAAHALGWLIHFRIIDGEDHGIEKIIETALLDFPDNPMILWKTGEFYLRHNRTTEALQILSTFLHITYEEPPHLCQEIMYTYWRFQRLAEAYYQNNSFKEANDLLEAILERYPVAIPTLETLSLTQAQLGNTKKSAQYTKKFTSLLAKEEKDSKSLLYILHAIRPL